MTKTRLLLALAVAWPCVASAADPVPKGDYPTKNGVNVNGTVAMGIDANGYAVPCGSTTVVTGCGIGGSASQTAITPTRSAPASTSPTTLTPGAATTVIPASASYNFTRYQAQGSGYACASWVTTAVTISANTATATCGGAGAYLITASYVESRTGVLPTTPLTMIAATGSSLVIAWETQ